MVQVRQYQRSAASAATISRYSCCCSGGYCRYGGCYNRYYSERLWTAITMVMITAGCVFRHSSSSSSSSSHHTSCSNLDFVQAWTSTAAFHQDNRNRRIHDRWNRQQYPNSPLAFVMRMAKAEADNEDTADFDVLEFDNVDDDDSTRTTKSSTTTAMSHDMKQMERVWRYNKKPLLSIGAQKGPTSKHGNSLRELLHHHTTVKVKIQLLLNSSSRNSDAQGMEEQMTQVYSQLKDYAAVADPSLRDMELLQVRVAERILLVGLPGTKQKIIDGTYPPPPPPPPPQNESDDQTTTK